MNKNYTAQELAEEIITQSEGACLEPDQYAPADKVQNWLDATDNDGDAAHISAIIYRKINWLDDVDVEEISEIIRKARQDLASQ